MANLKKEIADAQAKLERLKKKQREAEAKERSRFAEAVVDVIDKIENPHEVTVRELVGRARKLFNERAAERSESARKAAETRRRRREREQREAEQKKSHHDHTMNGGGRRDVGF